MTRYYFDVGNGDDVSTDDEGQEFSTPESAWTEAAHSAAEMARDKTHKSAAGHVTAIDVRDERGPVLSVRMSFETCVPLKQG